MIGKKPALRCVIVLIAAFGANGQAWAQLPAPITNASGSLAFAARLAVGQAVPAQAMCRAGSPQLAWNPTNLLALAAPVPMMPPGVMINIGVRAASAGKGTITLKCVQPGGGAIPDGPTLNIEVTAATAAPAPAPTQPIAPTSSPATVAVQGAMDATKASYDRTVAACRATPGCVPK